MDHKSLAHHNQSGFDAELNYKGKNLRVQVKGRAIINTQRSGHRLGQLKLEQEWDAVALVIMDADFETEEIYLAAAQGLAKKHGG